MSVVEQTREITTINFPKLNTELWRYRDEPGRLIPLLQSGQETYGQKPTVNNNILKNHTLKNFLAYLLYHFIYSLIPKCKVFYC